jgi:hypothetical protein
LGKVKTCRVFPGAVNQITEHHPSHVNQHQADQNFVGIEAVTQKSRDTRPKHAAQHTRQEDCQNDPAACVFVRQQGHAPGTDRTHDELSLGPDVPHVGPETHGQTQGDDQQRGGLDHQFTQGVRGFDRLPKKHLQTANGVFAQRHEERNTQEHSEQQSQDRRRISPQV